MTKRVTVVLDNDLVKKLMLLQSKIIAQNAKNPPSTKTKRLQRMM